MTVSEAAAVAVLKGLKMNSTLTTFKLSGPPIGPGLLAAALGEALKTNTTLTTLELTALTEEMAEVLSVALQENPSLLQLTYSSGTLCAPLRAVMARNNELLDLWVAVARVVRRGEAPGLPAVVAALTKSGLQQKLFSFYLSKLAQILSSQTSLTKTT